MLYSQHNRLTLLHKYTSTRESDMVHQSSFFVLHFSRLCCALHGSGRVCLITGHTFGLSGASPEALTLFGGVGLIAWRLRHPFLRENWRGPRYFGDCRTRLGYGPATEPTFKTALCHTRTLGRVYVKYQCTNPRDTITCDTICVVDG